MCNLYTLEETLNAWADAFEQFLGERLTLSAGPDTLGGWRGQREARDDG